ncbi:MAG: hypothetical protein A2Z46_07855 [Nitrospirae bacterium RBG_19FT_COMBO_55_12]|nr:MAG: hypothetical protein A2Z46_07855 [Nitrospirae bacterium RBG_19FT_COMBO_55_12]
MIAGNKIKLGISSCLLGENVRYDGGNKLDQYLMDTFGHIVEWAPFCPEVEAGLFVPREPMQLVREARGTRLITIETKQDRTDILTRWAERKLKQLEQEGIRGFVFKARSPSCGVRDAELFSSAGTSIGIRAGLFSEAFMIRFPSLPVEDEERLRDPGIKEKFLERILP